MPYDGTNLDEYLAECRDAGCTERQLEVLLLHLQGKAQAAIAARLGIEQSTVARHLDRVRRHLERQEDPQVLKYEVHHMVEQQVEEVVAYGTGDDADTLSVWRDAALEHRSANLHAIKPTRRRRKKPNG